MNHVRKGPDTLHQYDWVVVGAGIIGLCAAFHLATRGLRVCVVEQMQRVTNATTQSGAGIRYFDPDPVVSAQVFESQHFYSELDLNDDFNPCPSYYCFGTLSDTTVLDRASARGFRVLSRAQLQARNPDIDWRTVEFAVEDDEAGFRDPLRTWSALHAACERLGVRFQFGQKIMARGESGTTRQLFTHSKCYDTQGVILATGYWTPGLLARLGLPVVVRNRTITVHFLEGHNLSELPFVVEHESGFHARPTSTGGLLFGVPQLDWDVAPEQLPDGADDHLFKALRHLQRYGHERLSFSGVRTVHSADAFHLLAVGEHAALPTYMHVFAFGEGAAFKYAPAKTLGYVNSILGS